MTKKEAIRILIQEVESLTVDKESDPEYFEIFHAIKVLESGNN